MQKIKLNGKHAVGDFEFALVDDADFALVSAFRWKATPPTFGGKRYAIRNYREAGKYKSITMHRLVMAAPPGMDVDHINHNPVDNRRENLRVVDRATNVLNRKPVPFSGVCAACHQPFSLAAVPAGTERHIRYCSPACRPTHVKTAEARAAAAWRRQQGIEPPETE